MDTLPLEILALLFVVGSCAGFVDAVSGGGGLLALPALLWAGLDPVQALGTTKLQGTCGTLAASYNYVHKGYADLDSMVWSIALTLAGGVLGAVAVHWVNPSFLSTLIPFLLIIIAFYFWLYPRFGSLEASRRMGERAFALTFGLGIGFYDGFFGPGAGAFWATAYVGFLGYNLRQATAHTKVLNLVSNLSALAVFLIQGNILWSAGLVMGVGQLLGARLGSNLVISMGAKLVRPLIIAVSLAISLKLIVDNNPQAVAWLLRLF
ncbi:MAG: TSUP family transporter [Desulfarculaceae bacterium]|nr:TSUP family transporter [Desulfarculaceae bacterium]MCF8046748.1 TSUP family transporter [Desulfarculaceae bacterium]MCF8099300.1 TSUP family transporter [Desulfarculaceae bacterium]MCF8124526.1 TSUP family transporter [Desulfarculaceae bacterium]